VGKILGTNESSGGVAAKADEEVLGEGGGLWKLLLVVFGESKRTLGEIRLELMIEGIFRHFEDAFCTLKKGAASKRSLVQLQ